MQMICYQITRLGAATNPPNSIVEKSGAEFSVGDLWIRQRHGMQMICYQITRLGVATIYTKSNGYYIIVGGLVIVTCQLLYLFYS